MRRMLLSEFFLQNPGAAVAWDASEYSKFRWTGPDDGCQCGREHNLVAFRDSSGVLVTDQHGSGFRWDGSDWVPGESENRSYALKGTQWSHGVRWVDTGEDRVMGTMV